MPAGAPSAGVSAVRGHVVTFRADPFLDDDAFVHEPDGLVIIEDGVITAVGPFATLHAALPPGTDITDHRGCLVSAGFVDLHVHYVQTRIIGTPGSDLIDWLDHHTFTEELRFADRAYADDVARLFFDEVLANGTTTALAFAAVFPGSVDAFFEESSRRGTRMVGGKVLMDRNAPGGLLDTARSGYEESRDLIARWHGHGRNLYAVTPRFAPTSTPEQLELAGALWRESPGTYLHTHVAETAAEVAWVRSLFPERHDYLDVYDHHGLLGPRAVLAHGVHLSERELQRLHGTGTALAHCPTSNLFLGSGLFRARAARDPARPVTVGLGTDVGAGTSLSMLRTMDEALKVAELAGAPLTPAQALYLGTRGGAAALGLEDRIGSVVAGREADLVVLDPRATRLLAERTDRAESVDDLLAALVVLGDDRAVVETYVAGRSVHRRESVRSGPD